MVIDNAKRERELHDQINLNFARAAVGLQQAKDLASDSTKDISISVDSDTIYFVSLSDLHIPEGNMFYLAEVIKALAKIPNIYFGFGGDQINNSIKSSVGDTHSEVINPENQIKLLASILRETDKEVPFLDRVLFIESGNHENRTENVASINPAYVLSAELGLQQRYVKNIARCTLETLNREDYSKKVQHTMIATHAEQKPGKSGAQADSALYADLDRGVDVVVYGHNHKVAAASTIKQVQSSNNKTPIKKNIIFVNFGGAIAGGEYADRAGYTFPRIADMEILRLTNVAGEKKYDFINYKSLVGQLAKERISEVEYNYQLLENRSFNKLKDIERAYMSVTKKIYKNVTQKFKTDSAIKTELIKKTGVSDKIYFVPLSGFMIGNEERVINDEEINQKIVILSKLNGSCKIVLNGDMLFYKKAFTLTNKNGSLLGEKFPEDTFSYIESLAKMLEPVKNKIIAYNSGLQEEKIMKYHSEALAKMAMTRLQMSESLCYMPYNKVKLESEKLKIQAQQVDAYNKSNLANAVGKAMKDLDKALSDALPFAVENYDLLDNIQKQALLDETLKKYFALPVGGHYNEKGKFIVNENENKRADFLKDLIAPKLRHDGVLISLAVDKDYINYNFPLKDIELRTPNENLVQNILCTLLGIDPKNIIINAKPNTTSYVTAKVKDDKNKTRVVSFVGGNSKSTGSRATIENYLKAKQSIRPGANVYYTNARLGKEFMMLDKSVFTDPETNNKNIFDTIYISGGTFASGSENEIAPNKIYKLYATINKKEKVVSRSIYENAEDPYNLYCESLDYDTVLLEDEMLSEIIKNQARTSYKKVLQQFEEEQSANRIQTKMELFEKAFDLQTPKVVKTAKKENTTPVEATQSI